MQREADSLGASVAPSPEQAGADGRTMTLDEAAKFIALARAKPLEVLVLFRDDQTGYIEAPPAFIRIGQGVVDLRALDRRSGRAHLSDHHDLAAPCDPPRLVQRDVPGARARLLAVGRPVASEGNGLAVGAFRPGNHGGHVPLAAIRLHVLRGGSGL